MHVLDLPLERQKEISIEWGYASFDDFLREMEEDRKQCEEHLQALYEEHERGFTREEAEELIADIIANPEDKVGFAKRMAVHPEWVTAEKMIENIRSRIRD